MKTPKLFGAILVLTQLVMLSGLTSGAAPGTPAELVATVNASADSIHLSWQAVPGATKYLVYRGMDVVADQLIADNVSGTTFDDDTVTPYRTYAYAVSAYDVSEGEKTPPVLIWCRANAKTVRAEDLSETSVQDAIDNASDGDTVILPPGVVTWTVQVEVLEKAITISGAGMDNTIIMDGTGTEWNESLFWIQQEKFFRITGIQFKEINNPAAIYERGSKSFRVDHCRFFITAAKGVGVQSNWGSTGVVDHCDFFNSRVVPAGNKSDWQEPLSLGMSDGVYVEDCVFNRTVAGNSVDGHVGGHYVFRKNTVNDSGTEVHGFCCNLDRGYFMYEVYDNNFGYSEGITWGPICSRGGTGVIFNNTLVGDIEPPSVIVYNDRSMGRPNLDYGECDGSSPVDGNEDDSGYPCLDQIGRATDLGPDVGVPQLLEPLYEWNNVCNGADMDVEINPSIQEPYASRLKRQIQENRDYYNDTPRPGYEPYTYPHPLVTQFPPPPQTDSDAPTVPGNLRVTAASSRTVSLAWDASTDAGGSGLAGYYLWLNGRKVTSNSDSDYVQYTFLGLKEGQEYRFQVSAFDAAGNESAPTTKIRVIPGAPDLVLHGTPGDEAIRLDWTVNCGWPLTVTWHVNYYTTTASVYTATEPLSTTRSTVLTDHVRNYQWYTVTLHAMDGPTSILSDTVQVMPTDKFVYLPLVLK